MKEFFSSTPLFKLFRKNDPQTSFLAAEKVDTSKLQQLVYEAISAHGEHGCISDEVLMKFPTMPYSSITARYKALIDKKLIEVIGTRTGRSGRLQRVMRAVK